MFGAKLRKEILPIALPIFLGSLVFQVQTLTNRAFLGHVDVAFLGVISNVIFPLWTTMAMLNALSTGATILISQSLGSGDYLWARRLAAASIRWNGIFGVILFIFWFFFASAIFQAMGVTGDTLGQCIRYSRIASLSFLVNGFSSAICSIFQANQRTRPLMYSGAMRSGLNILLDFLFIFGSFGFPRLGYEGAALATVLSDIVGLIALVAFLAADKKMEVRPTIALVLRAPIFTYLKIMAMGIPSSLEDLLWNVGNLFLIGFLNMLDPMATTVYSLIFTIEILPIVAFQALGQTTTVLVGRAKGSGNPLRARGAAFTAQAAAWGFSLAIALVFALVPAQLVGIFTSDAGIVARAAPILLVSCFTFFPRSVNFISGSGIRGLGHTKWMLGTQVFGTIFIVSLGWLLIFQAGLGVLGLFIAMCVDEAVRAIVNGIRFLRGVPRDSRVGCVEAKAA